MFSEENALFICVWEMIIYPVVDDPVHSQLFEITDCSSIVVFFSPTEGYKSMFNYLLYLGRISEDIFSMDI
jgi:hypothetical protein